MSGRRLSVEFLGIPGTGKSAIASRVALILGEGGHAVDDLSYWLAYPRSRFIRFLRKAVPVASEMFLHPLATVRALHAIAAIEHPSLHVFGKMAFHWLLVSALARRDRTPGIHIHDQGIFQCFWSIGLGAGPESVGEIACRLWGSIPAPDLVVVVEADRPVILHRLALRRETKSRIDHLFGSQPEVLEHCARILSSTMSTLEAIRGGGASIGTLVLRCDGDDDLDRESRRLAALIESLAGQRVLQGTPGACPSKVTRTGS